MTEATKDEDQLHDDAEALRKETAEGSPEVAEHDRVAELEKELEDSNSKVLYAAAEIQNVRRRMEKEVSDARSYATTGFARDMLAIKDHLDRALAAVGEDLREDKTASQFLAGIEFDRKRAGIGVPAPRHRTGEIDRRATRSAPAPGDDGNPELRC